MSMPALPLSPEDLGKVSEARHGRLEQVNALGREADEQLHPAMVVFLRTVDDETFNEICPTNVREFMSLYESAEGAPSALAMFREAPRLDPETEFVREYIRFNPNSTMGTLSNPALPSPHPSSSSSYNEKVNPVLDERDGGRCLITKNPINVKAAHIYSRSLINKGPTDVVLPVEKGVTGKRMWHFVRAFMTTAEYTKCVAEYRRFINNEMHPIENYLSLSHDIQMDWARGVFALKVVSVSADRKKMTLQLVFSGNDNLPMDQALDALAEFNDTEGIDHIKFENGLYRLHNMETNTAYKNGDLLKITTHNPDTHPLPSATFLRMRYMYTRGLSFLARGLDEDDLNDDDSDQDVDPLRLSQLR